MKLTYRKKIIWIFVNYSVHYCSFRKMTQKNTKIISSWISCQSNWVHWKTYVLGLRDKYVKNKIGRIICQTTSNDTWVEHFDLPVWTVDKTRYGAFWQPLSFKWKVNFDHSLLLTWNIHFTVKIKWLEQKLDCLHSMAERNFPMLNFF